MATYRQACCFTGHRIIRTADKLTLKSKLNKAVEDLTETGVTHFLCGGALGFDTAAALAVLRLRDKNPNVKLGMILPCRTQAAKWSERDRQIYLEILGAADYIEYLSEEYTPDCMHARNRRMVDMAQYCVCYLRDLSSGTGVTVRYAESKGRTVIKL